MSTDEQKKAMWFSIGLVTTLAVCLCIAGSIFVFSFISDAFDTVLSSDLVTKSTATDLPNEADSKSAEMSVSEMYEILVLSDIDMDLAWEMRAILAETIVPESDPRSLAERFWGITNIPRVLSEAASPVRVGATENFWITDNNIGESFEITAEMAYATDHVYFWVEEGVEYEYEDAVELVDTFENEIYPTDREFFGEEWSPGVDGDVHLYILFSRGLGYSIAGLYGSIDEYSPLVHPYSNAHEIFYISADNVHLWEEFTYGVLAHEFQHMIHWYRDSNESTWLNEGFSEYAMLLNGYSTGGSEYTFASNTDKTLEYWPSGDESTAHYGQAFLFVTYFMDRFGKETTQAVIAHPANGLDSIDQVLQSINASDPQSGEPVGADDVSRDWATAMWLNDPDLSDGVFSFQSYDPPKPQAATSFIECPFDEQTQTVNQYGIDYIQFTCTGTYTAEFEGLQSVQVVPNVPHSGDFAFWSNRGDTSDMTLTRAFDFTDVSGEITFDYWVWYDIEEDWDYLYLLVSEDGGKTWQFINTPSGTDTNPTGNSYGWGYTGYSGGRRIPAWIQESVDLSAYAGEEILLRFEYITDAAVNGDGLLLDDLSIEAVDYQTDFESGDGGWDAAGFVRLYNQLPQTYRLVLIETGRETRIRELTLDENHSVQFEFSIEDEYSEAILIVIATARHTWQPAYYQFRLLP